MKCYQKTTYHSIKEAQEAANKYTEIRGVFLRAYNCSTCKKFHITKMAKEDYNSLIQYVHKKKRRWLHKEVSYWESRFGLYV